MEILKAETYQLSYQPEHHLLSCQGELHLRGNHTAIMTFLEHILAQEPKQIIFDLSQLSSLNSAGIIILAEFIIKVNDKKNIQLSVHGSKAHAWQSNVFKNFCYLMPQLKLKWY